VFLSFLETGKSNIKVLASGESLHGAFSHEGRRTRECKSKQVGKRGHTHFYNKATPEITNLLP
jgi:hypothetical protein